MARIIKMTFTGADDNVAIEDMMILCRRYPFIEFGILTRDGVWGGNISNITNDLYFDDRYPSLSWIREMIGRFTLENLNKHLSLHICPPLTPKILKDPMILGDFGGFARVQLNSKPDKFDLNFENVMFGIGDKQIIIQFNGDKPKEIYSKLMANYIRTCSYHGTHPSPEKIPFVGLFDSSGGRGILPKNGWQEPFNKELMYGNLIGFAGGLNPDNLKKNIDLIMEKVGNNYVWLDMETGCRTNNKFDLQKVELCCAIIEKEMA